MADETASMPGVYVSLDDLLALEYHGRKISFLPHQPVRSLLSGRFASRMRGRGLNFEEIRDYRPGDDVRSIDWKVTGGCRSRISVSSTRSAIDRRCWSLTSGCQCSSAAGGR